MAWLEDRIQPSGLALGHELTAHLPPGHEPAALVGQQDPGNGPGNGHGQGLADSPGHLGWTGGFLGGSSDPGPGNGNGHGPIPTDHPGQVGLGGPFGNLFSFFRPGNGNGNGHGNGGPGPDHQHGHGQPGKGNDNGGQSDDGTTDGDSGPTSTPSPIVSVGPTSSGSGGTTSTVGSVIGALVGSITGGAMTPTPSKHVSAPPADALTQAPAVSSLVATPAAHSAPASVTPGGTGDSSAQSVSAKQVGGNDDPTQAASHAAAAPASAKAPTTAASPAEHDAAPAPLAIALVAQPNAAPAEAGTGDAAEQSAASGNALALAAAGLPGSASLTGAAPAFVDDARLVSAAPPTHPETPGMPTVVESPTGDEAVVGAPAPLEPDLADWLLDRLPVDVAAVGAAAQVFLGGLESLGEELVSSESPLTRAAVVFGGLAVFVGWQARRRTRRAGRAAGDDLDPFSTRVWARGRWTTGGARA